MSYHKASNKDMVGKGLDSLLKGISDDFKNAPNELKTEWAEKAISTHVVPLEKIIVNPHQPRKDFDEASLHELALSIKIHQLIQPLTVSQLSNGFYQLIAGERRLRASKIAGLKEVPVYIRHTNDNQLLELALLENLQRENLNAMEIAISYKRLMDELLLTQEQVADRIGKERSTVTNYIRLLKLPPTIQSSVRENKISMGHARCLTGLIHIDHQLLLFKEILEKHLSVRQTEARAKDLSTLSATTKNKKTSLSPLSAPDKQVEDALTRYLGTKVAFKKNKQQQGTITIHFYSHEDLNNLLSLMKVTIR